MACGAAVAAGLCPVAFGPLLRAEEAQAPLKVCATVPDLGNLCKEVGGELVQVTVFSKGPQDPHFLEARPSFIKDLSRADLLIVVGLDLEAGWVPALLKTARNGKVQLGEAGYLDASAVVVRKDLPTGIIDRSLGDVHPQGNPHYLLDPVNGLRVARAIRDRLSDLRAGKKEHFASRYAAFASKLATALLGEKLVAKYDPEKIVTLYDRGGLEPFLKAQGDEGLLGGWAGRLARFRGAPFAADHNLWPYFAGRFDLKIVGFLEPKPGIAPTTRHLGELVAQMKSAQVRGILSVTYFDPRHAEFVAEKTGSRVIRLAHQCGARPATETYLSMMEYNVGQIEKALGEEKPARDTSGGEK